MDIGCDGLCFSDLEEDCEGVCGGNAVVDDCGVCNGNNKVSIARQVAGPGWAGMCWAGLGWGQHEHVAEGLTLPVAALSATCAVPQGKACDGICFSRKKRDCAGVCGGRAGEPSHLQFLISDLLDAHGPTVNGHRR